MTFLCQIPCASMSSWFVHCWKYDNIVWNPLFMHTWAGPLMGSQPPCLWPSVLVGPCGHNMMTGPIRAFWGILPFLGLPALFLGLSYSSWSSLLISALGHP